MINSKESNILSFFQESPHLNSPVSFHEARESCNLYLLIGLKIGQTLPPPPIYSTIFFFELVIIFFKFPTVKTLNYLFHWGYFYFLKRTFKFMQDSYFVVTVMIDAHRGRCWTLPIRVGRVGTGTEELRKKEEIKHSSSKMNSKGSIGLYASLFCISTEVPSAFV